jgi:hypothetical protein
MRIQAKRHARLGRNNIKDIVATPKQISRREHEEDPAIWRKVWEAIGGRGQRRIDYRRFQGDG